MKRGSASSAKIGRADFSSQKETPRIISRSAERDQRPTALDPCRLLEKAGENFY